MKQLEATVYPSTEKTIFIVNEDDAYGGAHAYNIKDCKGFNNDTTEYTNDTSHIIQFIQKMDDGPIVPGLQSEQLVYMLIDRHKKLNASFPSHQNEKMIAGLQMFIDACEERVKDRMNREVMGKLEK